MKKYLLLVATLILASIMLAVSASAEITLSYDLSTETVEGETLSVVTATLVDPDSVAFEIFYNEISFDNTMIIPADYEYGTAIESTDPADLLYSMEGMVSGRNKATVIEPSWKVDGATTTFEFDSYYNGTKAVSAATDLEVFKFYFVFADGKSAEDFTSDSFVVKRVLYQDDNVLHGCKYNEYNDMVVTNNVVPEEEVVVITVPVVAGDKVYLQDGTSVAIAEAGDYEVPATVGYVAVNSGFAAQKTYYINGTSAIEVHVNAALGSDEVDLRDRTLVDHDDNPATPGEDRNGLRFRMKSSQTSRAAEAPHEVVEAGFVMTVKSAKVIRLAGENFVLDMDMVNAGYAKKGEALNKETGLDLRFDSNDEYVNIIGVFYNIPLRETDGVKVPVLSRPYYKVGDTYIYGEIKETTLFDEATRIKNDEAAWNACSDSMQEYINEIIAIGTPTPVVNDEVIIDISGLYGDN